MRQGIRSGKKTNKEGWYTGAYEEGGKRGVMVHIKRCYGTR